MAVEIFLDQDWQGYAKGKKIIVTNATIPELKKQKIKFRLAGPKLKAGTGHRVYEFEKVDHPKPKNKK